jgi:hypothetical protein
MIVRCFVKSELDAISREKSVKAVFFAGRTEGKLTIYHQPSNHNGAGEEGDVPKAGPADVPDSSRAI